MSRTFKQKKSTDNSTIILEDQNFRETKIPPCELHQVHTEELDRTAPH